MSVAAYYPPPNNLPLGTHTVSLHHWLTWNWLTRPKLVSKGSHTDMAAAANKGKSKQKTTSWEDHYPQRSLVHIDLKSPKLVLSKRETIKPRVQLLNPAKFILNTRWSPGSFGDLIFPIVSTGESRGFLGGKISFEKRNSYWPASWKRERWLGQRDTHCLKWCIK